MIRLAEAAMSVLGTIRTSRKGVDAIARKIREVAGEHAIPIVEHPPLARALHATVEIEQEIPAEHYQAVAEVISYLMRLKRGLRGGIRDKHLAVGHVQRPQYRDGDRACAPDNHTTARRRLPGPRCSRVTCAVFHRPASAAGPIPRPPS
jgi:type III secretion system FlhB-like substrate exporter